MQTTRAYPAAIVRDTSARWNANSFACEAFAVNETVCVPSVSPSCENSVALLGPRWGLKEREFPSTETV